MYDIFLSHYFYLISDVIIIYIGLGISFFFLIKSMQVIGHFS